MGSLGLLVFSMLAAGPPSQQTSCEFTKLTAVDAEDNDRFGRSTALSGDVLVVGAPEMVGGGATGTGSAYVHRWDGYQWRFEQKLLADDAALQDVFGITVAVEDDMLLIGAPLTDDFADASGSVYVFRRMASEWIQEQELHADDAGQARLFGGAVLLSGGLAYVGSQGALSAGGGSALGAVYVFGFDGGQWSQLQQLMAADANAGDLFGLAISVDDAGDRALIGAPNDDALCGGNNTFCGAAYVFLRLGGAWFQETKLTEAQPTEGDLFGSGVAISGEWAFVGATGRDDAADGAGAVDVFRLVGNEWTLHSTLLPTGASAGDAFGLRVSVSGDRLLVSAYLSNAPCPVGNPACRTGAVYAFEFDGADWVQTAIVAAADVPEAAAFGVSVSVDSGRMAVGAWNDDGAGDDAGAAYVFQLDPPFPGDGDGDFDDDVDWADFGRFQGCFDTQILTTCCSVFDFDADGDVDLDDFEAFALAREASATGPR